MSPPRPTAQLATIIAATIGLIAAVQGTLPVMPAVQDALHISDAEVGWLTVGFVLPTALLALPFGSLSERFPPRTILAITLIGYGLAGLAHLWVGSFEALLALRFCQGVCVAAGMPLTLVLTLNSFHGGGQLRALSTRQTGVTLGELALPVLAGLLVVIAWTAPFVAQAVTIPLGLIVLRLFDPVTSGGGEQRARGVVAMTRDVFATTGTKRVALIGFLRFVFKYTFIAYVPILLVAEQGASVQQAALVVTISGIVTAAVANRVPAALHRFPPSLLLTAAAIAITGSMLGVTVATTWVAAILPAIVYGAGDGIFIVLQDAYIGRLWPAAARVGAASVSQTARNAGKLASPLIVTGLLALVSLPAVFLILAVVGFGAIAVGLSTRNLDAAFLHAG